MAKEILILGGGFAGLAAVDAATAGRRRDIGVTLIDRSPVSVFAPLLPDVISGGIRPEHLQYDLAGHCRRRGATFIRDEVVEIDAPAKTVHTRGGSHKADALVLCLGCETNYFDRDDLKAVAPGLKSIDEGRAIARAALEAVATERAANLLIVGGGYTGLEVAGHLALLLHRRLGLPYARLAEKARIMVLERSETPLKNVTETVRKRIVEDMGNFGVEISLGRTLESLTPDGRAVLTDGATFEKASAVWTPGVTASPAARTIGPEDRFERGRLNVDETLAVPGCDGVFAAGDLAGARRPGSQRPLRMGVQFSLAGGKTAGHNALHYLQGRGAGGLKRFDPFDPGYVVPLAPGRAAGRIMGVTLLGRLPLLLHYLMCSARSYSAANKFGVLKDLLSGETRDEN